MDVIEQEAKTDIENETLDMDVVEKEAKTDIENENVNMAVFVKETQNDKESVTLNMDVIEQEVKTYIENEILNLDATEQEAKTDKETKKINMAVIDKEAQNDLETVKSLLEEIIYQLTKDEGAMIMDVDMSDSDDSDVKIIAEIPRAVKQTFVLPPNAQEANILVMSVNGRYIACSSEYNVLVYHARSGKLCHTLKHEDIPRKIVFDSQEEKLATGCQNGDFRVYDVTTKKPDDILITDIEFDFPLQAIRFSSDMPTVMTACKNKAVFWNYQINVGTTYAIILDAVDFKYMAFTTEYFIAGIPKTMLSDQTDNIHPNGTANNETSVILAWNLKKNSVFNKGNKVEVLDDCFTLNDDHLIDTYPEQNKIAALSRDEVNAFYVSIKSISSDYVTKISVGKKIPHGIYFSPGGNILLVSMSQNPLMCADSEVSFLHLNKKIFEAWPCKYEARSSRHTARARVTYKGSLLVFNSDQMEEKENNLMPIEDDLLQIQK